VNDLVEHRREIEDLHRAAKTTDGTIVVIGAARTNEWNQSPESLTSLAADVDIIGLPYLHPTEIDELLKLLERHHALDSLEPISPEERKQKLESQAGRQLLVALHEATHGRTFIDIIADEYDGITSRKAQEIYLTVCLLNQLGAKVRAGIVSRMHGVEFEEFKQNFFRPLEQVVIVRTARNGDHTYEARHPLIAEFVVGKLQESKSLFRQLARARVGPEDRYREREPLEGSFRGRVDRVHATHFLIARDGDGAWILASCERVPPDLWQSISIGQRLKFRIAFCLSGTVAIDVEPI